MTAYNYWEKDGRRYMCPACSFAVNATRAVIDTYVFCPGCGKRMIGGREGRTSGSAKPIPEQFTKAAFSPQGRPRPQSLHFPSEIPVDIGVFSPDIYQFVPALDDESDITQDY